MNFLWYLLRHKWYVFVEMAKRGMWWRGVWHDWSKFIPMIFKQYRALYNLDDRGMLRDDSGFYNPIIMSRWKCFKLHQQLEPHHWESWGELTEIPEPYRTEMLCDWIGASKAQGNGLIAWYYKNKNYIRIHDKTREWIEGEL